MPGLPGQVCENKTLSNNSIEYESYIRASNSPALRGSVPPGRHYFSHSPAKHVKSHASMKTNPAKHVKSPASWWINLENNYLTNLHMQGGMQPPKNILTNLDLKRMWIKNFIAQ